MPAAWPLRAGVGATMTKPPSPRVSAMTCRFGPVPAIASFVFGFAGPSPMRTNMCSPPPADCSTQPRATTPMRSREP